MKLLSLYLCLLMLPAGISLQQQPTEEEMTTQGALNGHTQYGWNNGKAWRLLGLQSKIDELIGIEEGMLLMLREAYPSLSPADRAVLDARLERLIIKGFRTSDIAEQIDGFYKDSSNLRIPVVDAYKYAIRKMHGASQHELDELDAALRATYNR